MPWIASHGLLLVLFAALWCRRVSGCREAHKEMSICLHTYLERDFMEVEPFLLPTESPNKQMLNSGPAVQSLCEKYKIMVDCYSVLDGQCYDLLERKRFSYLLHTLFTFHEWLCDETLKLKQVTDHLACILQVQKRPKACKLERAIPNVWPRMLRLEEAESTTCPSLHEQLGCLRQNRLVEKHCGNVSQAIYEKAMQMWLDGWCIDYSSAPMRTTSVWVLLISTAMCVLVCHF